MSATRPRWTGRHTRLTRLSFTARPKHCYERKLSHVNWLFFFQNDQDINLSTLLCDLSSAYNGTPPQQNGHAANAPHSAPVHITQINQFQPNYYGQQPQPHWQGVNNAQSDQQFSAYSATDSNGHYGYNQCNGQNQVQSQMPSSQTVYQDQSFAPQCAEWNNTTSPVNFCATGKSVPLQHPPMENATPFRYGGAMVNSRAGPIRRLLRRNVSAAAGSPAQLLQNQRQATSASPYGWDSPSNDMDLNIGQQQRSCSAAATTSAVPFASTSCQLQDTSYGGCTGNNTAQLLQPNYSAATSPLPYQQQEPSMSFSVATPTQQEQQAVIGTPVTHQQQQQQQQMVQQVITTPATPLQQQQQMLTTTQRLSVLSGWTQETETPGSRNRSADRRQRQRRPQTRYIDLIVDAVLTSPEKKADLPGIYQIIQSKNPFYRDDNPDCPQKWKNAVRHNISSHKDLFDQVGQATARGHVWRVHPAIEDLVRQPGFSTREAKLAAQYFKRRNL